jgi:hypothetical protein
VSATLEGAEQALRSLDKLVELNRVKLRDAVEYILSEMRDYAKAYAPFRDITGNLRNSIQYEMDPGGKPAGTLYAGMEYAIWVELREGYWVLQGAIDAFEPVIRKVFKDKIKIQRQELSEKYISSFIKP